MRRFRRPAGAPPRASLPRSLCFLWGFRLPGAVCGSPFPLQGFPLQTRNGARGAMLIRRKKKGICFASYSASRDFLLGLAFLSPRACSTLRGSAQPPAAVRLCAIILTKARMPQIRNLSNQNKAFRQFVRSLCKIAVYCIIQL